MSREQQQRQQVVAPGVENERFETEHAAANLEATDDKCLFPKKDPEAIPNLGRGAAAAKPYHFKVAQDKVERIEYARITGPRGLLLAFYFQRCRFFRFRRPRRLLRSR